MVHVLSHVKSAYYIPVLKTKDRHLDNFVVSAWWCRKLSLFDQKMVLVY